MITINPKTIVVASDAMVGKRREHWKLAGTL
jgi:hypothetical protein